MRTGTCSFLCTLNGKTKHLELLAGTHGPIWNEHNTVRDYGNVWIGAHDVEGILGEYDTKW